VGVRRVWVVVIGVLVAVVALSACGGSDASSSAPGARERTIHFVGTLHCDEGQVVERVHGYGGLYECVTPSPALPRSHAPEVQQGDPCPVFGATTYNAQGDVFDCEPWGPNNELRWILP
jgi:hypothetical protein